MDAEPRSFTSRGVMIAGGILILFIAAMVAISASGDDDTLAATTPAVSSTPPTSAATLVETSPATATTPVATTAQATTPATNPADVARRETVAGSVPTGGAVTVAQAQGTAVLAAAHVEECFGRNHDYGLCTTQASLINPPFTVVRGTPGPNEVSIAASGRNYAVTVADSSRHLWRISKHAGQVPGKSCHQPDGISECTDTAW